MLNFSMSFFIEISLSQLVSVGVPGLVDSLEEGRESSIMLVKSWFEAIVVSVNQKVGEGTDQVGRRPILSALKRAIERLTSASKVTWVVQRRRVQSV
ncbi:hypothetical protein TNCV_3219841 [Trichonephila clavipes]|nr:hypothetical protein TNCV_3219841 [Trichonephila clavipes]